MQWQEKSANRFDKPHNSKTLLSEIYSNRCTDCIQAGLEKPEAAKYID
jgi:hypothetical protein